MPPHRPPLVLHSSRARLALSWSAPVLLIVIGLVGVADEASGLPVTLLVIGLVLLAIVLYDLPVRTEFDDDGLVRVCPVRRQRVPWDEVVALERIVSGARQRQSLRRGEDHPRSRAPARSQGLTARLGPRRVSMLVDRLESHGEFTELKRLVAGHATMVRATEPPIDSPPAGRGPAALHVRGGA